MAAYSFHTHWMLMAPVERVFDALHAVEEWPRWWPYVRAVTQLAAGDADGVGAVRRYVWSSRLPYTLAFDMRVTQVQRPHRLQGEAFGELTGTGIWTLREERGDSGPVTAVDYAWEVRTTRGWMNLVAPLARSLFAWNHDQVMRAGGEGLARWLAAGWAGTHTAQNRGDRE